MWEYRYRSIDKYIYIYIYVDIKIKIHIETATETATKHINNIYTNKIHTTHVCMYIDRCIYTCPSIYMYTHIYICIYI